MPWYITDGVLQKADSAPSENSIPANIKTSGKVIIPEGVTVIAEEAFRSCAGIQSITFPDSLTAIGKNAFLGCAELTHVLLPEGVKSIGETAFRSCLTLKLVELPKSLEHIGEGALSECRHLTRILLAENHPHFRLENDMLISADGTLLWAAPNMAHAIIPDGVTSIESEAFGGRRSLLSVVFPKGLKRIGRSAFYWCDNLTEIFLPDSVTEIGSEAFAYCHSLKSLNLPAGITQLEYSTFESCSFTSLILPAGLKCIGSKVFRWCTSLEHIVLPEGLTTIADAAFCHCRNLKKLHLPDSVTSIGICAFDRCGSLKEISLPDSVTTLGAAAFIGVEHLNIPAHLFEQLDKDTLSCLTALACPIPLKQAPANVRLKLCVGFGIARYRYPDTLHAEYFLHIKKNASKLMKQAFEYPELLRLMCREKLISAKDVDAFLTESLSRENVELTALLLRYQAEVLTMDKVSKARERREKAQEKRDEIIIDRIAARAGKVGIDGLNFAVTGKLKHFSKRDELKAFITEHGARLQNTMSANTDYLITNDMDSGSAKNQKAAELGITIITEDEFLKMAQNKTDMLK